MDIKSVPPTAPAFRDVAILTRAVDNVFRKLIRILIGRMSLKKLQEMIQLIFVEEAEAKLKKEAPGKSVALSKLGSITDLDTRTLTKLRSFISSNQPRYLDTAFLRGFTPGFKVLDLWINKKKYQDSDTKKPLALAFSGNGISFENLVEEAISARGVTARSMLDRLVENKFIRIDSETEMIELIRDDYIFLNNAELDMIDVGFTAIGNLATTVAHNVENAESKANRFYQRGCWTYRLNINSKKGFEIAMSDFLHEVDRRARDAMTPYEEDLESTDQITAGISMFYYEEGMG